MSSESGLFGMRCEKGTVIFREGEDGETMYIIQSGAVEISRDKRGEKAVLAILEEGDFFGEMALVDRHVRSATATAVSPCRLLACTRSSIMERIRRDPGVVMHLLSTLCRRIADTNRRILSLVRGNETLRAFVASKGAPLPIAEGDEGDSDSSVAAPDIFAPSTRDTHAAFPSPLPMRTIDLGIPRELCIRVDEGSPIFHRGDPGNAMFITIEGGVEISQGPADDRSVIALLSPGEFFGETALVTDQPRTAHAYATETTSLYVIPKDNFSEQLETKPELGLYILQGLIIRLRGLLSFLDDPTKSVSIIRSLPPPLRKESRIKTAIVSLSTCGGCAAILLENREKLSALLTHIDISYCPMLIDAEVLGEVDLAVVDGVVRVKEDEEKVREVRHKSTYLVAWGTCAAFGGIPAYANQQELEEIVEESYGQAKDPFAYYLSGSRGVDMSTYQELEGALQLLRRARKLDDFVRVDCYIPGCPPAAGLLDQLVAELRGEEQTGRPKSIVCGECSRKPVKSTAENFWMFPRPDWDVRHCFTSFGSACLGFITKGGCGAVCPRGGLPCWGCRGPSETVLKRMEEGLSFDECMVGGFVSRHRHIEDQITFVMKLFRKHANSPTRFNRYVTNDRTRIR